jgi:hypothetical protein
MSPRPKPVLTRLDARYPILWRDASTVQFGLEGIVTLDVGEPWVEPLLTRLRSGIRLSTFDVVAHGVGAPRAAAKKLLSSLRPVLVTDPKSAPPAFVEDVNVSDGRTTERMRQSLADEGIRITGRADADAVAVVVVEGAAAALQFAPYLREDRAHLPVAFEHDAVTVGPLVIPGRTPCLSCRDEHERRRDEAWPILHAQLVGRTVEVTTARVAGAASLVTRVLRTPVEGAGVMVRVNPDGRRVWRSLRHHEGCPCLGTSCRSQPGSGTAPDPLDPRSTTTRSPESALRA